MNQNNEDNVFRAELAKYDPYRKRVSENIKQQSKLLEELTMENAKLAKSTLAQESVEIAQARAGVAKRLKDASVTYHEIRTNAMYATALISMFDPCIGRESNITAN